MSDTPEALGDGYPAHGVDGDSCCPLVVWARFVISMIGSVQTRHATRCGRVQ